jgi:phage protein D
MTPNFRLVADGTDITGLINDRLIQLSGSRFSYAMYDNRT